MRRLPVYLLLDCSESMIGDGITGVQRGLEFMLRTLRSDPHALETVWMSCIAFDKTARLLFPLTELADVQPPTLSVHPGTALGAALNLCADRIQAEVRKTTVVQKGDWRPLIVILTDGQPTDDCTVALLRLGQKVHPRPANIYAIGCGEDVDMSGMRELTDIVLHMKEMTEEKFRKLFVWLSASVTESSRGIHETEGGISLEKLPMEVVKVDHSYVHDGGPQRQILLYARCTGNRAPYLMRYRWNAEIEEYNPTAVYAVDLAPGEDRAGFALPAVNSSQIVGIPRCPHCNAPGGARCGLCGGLMCADSRNFQPHHCPHCNGYLDAQGGGGSFDVVQSLA